MENQSAEFECNHEHLDRLRGELKQFIARWWALEIFYEIYARMTCTKIHYEKSFSHFRLSPKKRLMKKWKSKEFHSLKMGVWKRFLVPLWCLRPFNKRLRKKRKFLFKTIKEVKFSWMEKVLQLMLKACFSWFWIIITSLHLKSQIFVSDYSGKSYKNTLRNNSSLD